MILDARPHLEVLLSRTDEGIERDALKTLLDENLTISASLTFLGNDVVWLFVGPVGQIGVPLDLMPELTAAARADGTLQRLLDEIEATMLETLESLRKKLFP